MKVVALKDLKTGTDNKQMLLRTALQGPNFADYKDMSTCDEAKLPTVKKLESTHA